MFRDEIIKAKTNWILSERRSMIVVFVYGFKSHHVYMRRKDYEGDIGGHWWDYYPRAQIQF